MKKIEQSLHIHFAFALACSILMVLGVPMIVCGATKPDWLPLPTLFLILGIILSGGGFYGVPILWTTYGARRELRVLIYAVEVLELRDVAALSSHLRKPAEEVRTKLDTCLSQGYLPRLYREGDRLIEPTRRQNPADENHDAVCPCCSAHFTYRGTRGICPYCGVAYNTKHK